MENDFFSTNEVLIRLTIGFGLNLLIGTIAFLREMIDDTGFLGGVVIFTLIYVFLGWEAYFVIIVFFLINGAVISLENKDKANKGEFELYKAKRPIGRVLGRSLAGAIFAGLFFLTDRQEFKFAFVASYAEAIFDTVSTKLGKFFSREAVLITDFRKIVHRGTPGAISWQGTLLGIVAALLVSAAGIPVKLIQFNELLIVLFAAFLGGICDSVLSALAYSKRYIPNEVINFSSSMAAGFICIFLIWLVGI